MRWRTRSALVTCGVALSLARATFAQEASESPPEISPEEGEEPRDEGRPAESDPPNSQNTDRGTGDTKATEEASGDEGQAEGENEPDEIQDDSGAGSSSGEEEERQPVLVPPEIVMDAPARLPRGSRGEGQVVLSVRVGMDGLPSDIQVVSGLSKVANDVAIASLKSWKFRPASRDGVSIAARIHVGVEVEAAPSAEEKLKSDEAPVGTQSVEVSPDEHPDHDHAHPGDVHMEVTVHGEKALRTKRRSASDFFVHREVLEAAPHEEGADVLRAAPGLTVLRGEGLAQAHSYSLRGFDAEHGQDIEFIVGGLPINMPSHIHGQGYADLGFLIGSVVDQLDVTEGVNDPSQGDFAVAGTLRVGLGVDENRRGLQARTSFGTFNTQRHEVVWAPKESPRESLGAAQYTSTDGFGEQRKGKSASGLLQHRFGGQEVRYRVVGLVHAARADFAGLVRREDIDSKKLCFHCAYPDASARSQNGLSQRLMAGFFADYRGPAHANGTLGFYVGKDHFRNQSNYTGYLARSRSLPGVAGRGDLVAQENDTTTLGVTGRYRTEAFEPVSWAHGTVEVGLDGRLDTINQTQSLLDGSVRNQIWDERVDAAMTAVNTSIWGDLDWQFGSRLYTRVGVRASVLSYDVNDRLGNFAPLSRPQDQSLPGFRRSSMGTVVGPRSSVELKVYEWFRLLGSYGQGYRSPQARTLQDGEEAPFARVQSADAGVRFRLGDPLDLTASGYFTHLSDDVAFDATEGRLERIGPTRRAGAVVYAVTRPTSWLLSSLSVTYVGTSLLEPPPPTADEPDPPFEKGQPLPFIPPVVVRLDASAKTILLGSEQTTPLIGRWGLGFTYLGPRSLPYNQNADSIPLLDASLGLSYGVFDFSVAGFNLLDLDYAASEQVFVSDWEPTAPTSRTPARHISAGAPLSVMGTLGVTL